MHHFEIGMQFVSGYSSTAQRSADVSADGSASFLEHPHGQDMDVN